MKILDKFQIFYVFRAYKIISTKSFFYFHIVLGAGLYSMALYGGLLLFSAFLLYDTQRLVKVAEHHPQYAAQRYDPINA